MSSTRYELLLEEGQSDTTGDIMSTELSRLKLKYVCEPVGISLDRIHR
jgi:hypothetical protein